MPIYKVRPGFTHGAQKQYKAGDTVEYTEAEAAGFLDKLELVTGQVAKGETKQGGLVVNPAPAGENVEQQLLAETGRDFVQSGSQPPTFVETDKPAPAVPRRTTRS